MTQPAPNTSDFTCTNPACGVTLRAGTRFCATCGTAAGPAAPPQPPQPPFPSRGVGGIGGLGGGYATGVVADRSIDVQMAPEWAYNHATQALQSLNAEVSGAAPGPIMAVIPYKSLGKPVRFNCQINIQPAGPVTTRFSYGVKVDWGSTMLIMGILGAFGLFNVMFLTGVVGPLAPLASIAALGWAAYDYAVAVPNKLAGQLQKRLALAPSQPGAVQEPAPSNVTPISPVFTQAPVSQPVAPQVVTPQPVAPAPAAPSPEPEDIVARIEKLAALRDKGLLSEAEFDKRRTELLDRL